jgi:hypothetical protein
MDNNYQPTEQKIAENKKWREENYPNLPDIESLGDGTYSGI